MAGHSISPEKLQHIYDLHASDFGLAGRKNLQQLQLLAELIAAHLANSDTKLVLGYYRGIVANLFFNSATTIVVVTDASMSVVAAYKVSSAQATYIESTGRLN